MHAAPLKSAAEVAAATAVLLRAPRRVLPADAAAEHLRSEKGAWEPTLAPMMLEPLNQLAGREYNGIVFVGSARTSKTMTLVLGGIVYVVTCAPGDVLVTLMSQDSARDFSKMDLDRMLRHSPAVGQQLSPRASDDNVYDKFLRSGTVIKIGWPAITQLSQKTLRYVFLTDYDRPKNRDNVDGEGTLWDLAYKRIETFMSRGKLLAESSPEAEYLDPAWKPNGAHEAPPCRGILELYNRGTRARWYWPCPECGDPFQALPGLGNFGLIPPDKELDAELQSVDSFTLAEKYGRIVCPNHGCVIDQDKRFDMSARGAWVHEGQAVDGNMRVAGTRRHTKIASYWLGGVAAAFQRWDSMLTKYFDARLGYLRTGEEQSLKGTVNMDQGAAYLPRVASARRSAEDLRSRLEKWPRARIPEGVRFLTAAIDVQAHRFVVEVFGWGVGLESWLIDRYAITASNRMEGDRNAALEPGAYLEDWLQILPMVMERRYETVAGGVWASPVITICDSGGKTGVTFKAYQFWRALKKQKKHWRLHLVKGASSRTANVATRTYPDSTDRKDRVQGGRGDVPVWLINTHVVKDAVVGDLGRDVVGPGYCHLPDWLAVKEERGPDGKLVADDSYFAEITAETRTDKGWQNLARVPNEAFDLHVYNRVACKILRADRINWADPDKVPKWARGLVPGADQGSPVIEGSEDPASVAGGSSTSAPSDEGVSTPTPAPAPKVQSAKDKLAKHPGWGGTGSWIKPGGWRK